MNLTQDALRQVFVCPFVSASGTLRWGGYSQQERQEGKEEKGAGGPSGSIYRSMSNIYAYSTMSTSAFIAWATSLCDSKKLGTSSGYLYVAC